MPTQYDFAPSTHVQNLLDAFEDFAEHLGGADVQSKGFVLLGVSEDGHTCRAVHILENTTTSDLGKLLVELELAAHTLREELIEHSTRGQAMALPDGTVPQA